MTPSQSLKKAFSWGSRKFVATFVISLVGALIIVTIAKQTPLFDDDALAVCKAARSEELKLRYPAASFEIIANPKGSKTTRYSDGTRQGSYNFIMTDSSRRIEARVNWKSGDDSSISTTRIHFQT